MSRPHPHACARALDRPRRDVERAPPLARVRALVRRHDRPVRRQPRDGRHANPGRRQPEHHGALRIDPGLRPLRRQRRDAAPVGQTVYVVVTSPTQKVTDPAYAAAIETHRPAARGADRDRRRPDGADVRVRSRIRSTSPPTAGLVSPDLSTRPDRRRFVPGDGDRAGRALEPIPGLDRRAPRGEPGPRDPRLSNTLANQEISELVNRDLDGSLRLTIPITFVILLIAFGALVAAFVPLVLAITALLAAFGAAGHLQPGRRPGQPVRQPAGRPDRPRRRRRLLAVHGHARPPRVAARPRPPGRHRDRPAAPPAGRCSSAASP